MESRKELTTDPHAVMTLILHQLATCEVIEDSAALFRRCGVSIGFRTLAEEVLSPLQKSGQIRSENLHANRYTLAGSPASAAAAAAATDGGAGKAQSKAKAKAKGNKKDAAAVDEAAWRRALEECLALGSPEARIWRMVGGGCDQPTPLTVEEVGMRTVEPIFKGAMMEAKKNGWVEVTKDKATGQVTVQVTAKHQQHITDRVQDILRFVSEAGVNDGGEDAVVKAFSKEEVAALKKRRFIEQTSFTFHRISRGPRFTPEWASQADDLTAQHIASGSWADVELKRYDFDRQVRPAVVAGGFHPMYRLQALARAAMLEMGFEELPQGTGYVESVASASLGREEFYAEEEREATLGVKQAAVIIAEDGTGDDALILRNSHYSLLARVLSSMRPGGVDGSLKLFVVERAFVRQAKTKRKDRTARADPSSPRQTQRRVLRRKAQQAEQLRLSGFVVVADGEPTLPDLLGTLHVVCAKLGLESDRYRVRPCPIEGSSCGAKLLFEGALKTGQPALHLGRAGLLHPHIVARLLVPREPQAPSPSPTTLSGVMWWEFSLEALGEALGHSASSSVFEWLGAT